MNEPLVIAALCMLGVGVVALVVALVYGLPEWRHRLRIRRRAKNVAGLPDPAPKRPRQPRHSTKITRVVPSRRRVDERAIVPLLSRLDPAPADRLWLPQLDERPNDGARL